MVVPFPIAGNTSVDCMVGIHVIVVRRVRSRLDGQSRVGSGRGGGKGDGKGDTRGVELCGTRDGVMGGERDIGKNVVIDIVISIV